MEIIGGVLDKLVPVIAEEIDLHLNANEKAETLVKYLKDIQQLLDDAETKQLAHKSIKTWLGDVQDLAYDVEDALDDWLHQNQKEEEEGLDDRLQHRGEEHEASNLWSKVCLWLQLPCSFFRKLAKSRSLISNITNLNERVKKIYEEGMQKALVRKEILQNSVSQSEGSSDHWRRTTSDSKSEVIGRKTDEESIKKMLFSKENNKDDVEVICIVGQGGMGKTTLAQKIYNDENVKKEFPFIIWVCVSDPFNELAIAKAIYEQLERHSPNVSELQAIKNEIRISLCEKSSNAMKRYLLVLDDVWTEDSQEWKPLIACLRHGAKGSKILATTRKRTTATALGASKSYPLGEMKDEDCWSIIRHMALPGRDEVNCRHFKDVGLGIAKTCSGSPLAASFLGGHLKDKTRVREWQEVLESEIWKLEDVENKLFRHFFLSYNELKPAVKHCFAYCSMFPKDYLMEKELLIRHWIAQGFLSSSNMENDEMEAIGRGYFNDLVQRSFFQNFEKDELDETVECKMHDIVHDFAQYLSTKARYFCWDHELQQKGPPLDFDKLRSVFCHGGLPPENIIVCLKRVRELSLVDCGLENIPDEIGNLINLRYLELRSNRGLKELPKTICNLYNLQTLNIVYCNISGLPEGISNLRNLRYLTSDIKEYPSEIASLTNLRFLGTPYKVSQGFMDPRYLKGLNQLEFLSFRLVAEANVEAAKTASLDKKEYLDHLILEYDDEVKIEVLEALEPHKQLQILEIDHDSLIFPSWIAALDNLKSLIIYNRGLKRVESLDKCSSLLSIWKLPFLEYFGIWGGDFEEHWIGNGFFNLVCSATSNNNDIDTNQLPLVVFPSLKKLKLNANFEWREWKDMSEEEEDAITRNNILLMPNLTHLEIYLCEKLESLPLRTLQQLPSLQTLRIIACHKLKRKYGSVWTPKFDVIFEES